MGGIYSQETAREIDVAVRALIDRAFARATKILTRHRDVLEDTAKRLLAQETLSEEELPELPPEPGEKTKAAE
jgi:cell division protease FtsH